MRKLAVVGGAIAVALGGFLAMRSGAAAGDVVAKAATGPLGSPRPAVVVELFSSEGCSSCPPADAYLLGLDRTQAVKGVTVIALEEHVDYWNDLGWADPFSRPQFSDRQREYATALGDRRIYTPELLVDGHTPTDRSRAEQDLQASAREPKARIDLDRRGDRLGIAVRDVPKGGEDDPAEVWLALTESDRTTRVERGENAGQVLAHAPVVRRLEKVGTIGADGHLEAPLEVAPGWDRSALRAVVFVQRSKSRHIVGAVQVSL
jgi:hypothetical protein